jgi:exopolysaccharide biosynthesis polyprenyl glycosylphosphotransferase
VSLGDSPVRLDLEDGASPFSADAHFPPALEPIEGIKEVRLDELPSVGFGSASKKSDREPLRRFLFISDLCLIWMSSGAMLELSSLYSRIAHPNWRAAVFPAGTAGFLLLFSVLIVLFAHIHGFYELPWNESMREEMNSISKSLVSAALIASVCIYLWGIKTPSTRSIALAVLAAWISLLAWRRFIRSQSIPGLTEQRNILIVGCGPNGALLRRHLEQHPEIGFIFKGYIDRRSKGRAPDPERNKEEADILGPAEKLVDIAREHFIDEVFVTVPSDRYLVKEIARHAQTCGLPVRVIPDLYDGPKSGHTIEYVGHFPTMTLNRLFIPTLQLIIKRLADIVVSASLLVLLLPFLLLIGAIVRLDSRGPVLYRSLRIGKKGKTFLCCKFRTMVANAEALKDKLDHLNERDGILFKIGADPRVTGVGRILRKFSLDELPQLWNVLKQDMSLVGPRPSVPGEYEQYSLEHLRRLDVMPGVTGLWQVMARKDPSFDNYITLDKEYVNNWNLRLDCKILMKTVGVVLAGTGQ